MSYQDDYEAAHMTASAAADTPEEAHAFAERYAQDMNSTMADFPDAVPGGHRVETCRQACCETCPPDSRRNEDGK